MRTSLIAVSLSMLALTACGGEVSGAPDAGLGMDASRPDAGGDTDAGGSDSGPASDGGTSDAGEADGGAADAGVIDGGATDAAVIDGGASDAGASDGGPDAGCPATCATPAPLCGASCDDACGCCDCAGPGFCSDGAAWNCAGGCVDRTPCGDSDCSVNDSGVASCGSCSALEARYMDLVTGTDAQRCENPDSCQVLFGHCRVVLGGCHYGVNLGVTQAQLDAIAAQWTARGCEAGRPVCRCTAPPSVRCDSGGCLLGGIGSGS